MRGCAVSRRYIGVCNCDMFSVVNMYLEHLKFCVVCINGRRYGCCTEGNRVSNESSLMLGLCACVESVVTWSSLVCL